MEGPGKFADQKPTVKGKKYFRLVLYIPKSIAQDSQFPFRPEEVVFLKVENDKMIVSKIHNKNHHKELLAP